MSPGTVVSPQGAGTRLRDLLEQWVPLLTGTVRSSPSAGASPF